MQMQKLACTFLNERACISCVYLVRDLMIISRCTTGKECVIVTTLNTRAGTHGGDKYSIFRSYWDYVYFRIRKSLRRSLTLSRRTMPLSSELIARRSGVYDRAQEMSEKSDCSRSFRFHKCGQCLDNKTFYRENRTYIIYMIPMDFVAVIRFDMCIFFSILDYSDRERKETAFRRSTNRSLIRVSRSRRHMKRLCVSR